MHHQHHLRTRCQTSSVVCLSHTSARCQSSPTVRIHPARRLEEVSDQYHHLHHAQPGELPESLARLRSTRHANHRTAYHATVPAAATDLYLSHTLRLIYTPPSARSTGDLTRSIVLEVRTETVLRDRGPAALPQISHPQFENIKVQVIIRDRWLIRCFKLNRRRRKERRPSEKRSGLSREGRRRRAVDAQSCECDTLFRAVLIPKSGLNWLRRICSTHSVWLSVIIAYGEKDKWHQKASGPATFENPACGSVLDWQVP